MTNNSAPYIEIHFNNNQDYDNLRKILESNFLQFTIKTRKKLLIIATELVQNNIIHNNSNPCVLKIYENYENIILEITQEVNKIKLEKILNKISCINNYSDETLKDIYKKNIVNSSEKRVGNGLILSRIKSGNKIEIKSEESSDKKVFNLQILIKLKHYE